MTKNELNFIRKILEHIKNPDEQIFKAIAFIDKNIAIYEAQRRQLKESYDYEWPGYGQ